MEQNFWFDQSLHAAMPAQRASRRRFLKAALLGGAALALPGGLSGADLPSATAGPDLLPLFRALLQDWCDGLVKLQVRDAARPEAFGAFRCPACASFHGRCGDAVYPLLRLAHSTGEARYLDAAVRLGDWTRNVESPDGAWTNELDKKSWKGITVFESIAFAEAIHWHGTLLDKTVRERWLARLRLAANFIYDRFTLEYSNINYGVTGSYALALLSRVLEEPRFQPKARDLARGSLKYLTRPNRLLFGEGKPMDKLSPKGCPPVDLGYNVEESLPSLALYGLLEKDAEVLEAVTASLAAHLEFMLPDGGWDNSWGTRSFKWTYWGSRTSDGCQSAYALLADRHPGFAAAAYRNAQLMRSTTHDGLLYGGPHYASQGVPACVHHTFTHAKAMATVLDHARPNAVWDTGAALPRETAQGVREFPEISTALLAHGPWRATLTGYDWLYQGDVFHATGGALAMVHHARLGVLCCASLAKYELVEAHNQQLLPDNLDFPLTPRVETWVEGKRFSNLFDIGATYSHEMTAAGLECRVKTRLVDASQHAPAAGELPFQITYRFTNDAVFFEARPLAGSASRWSLVVPVVSPRDEKVRRCSDTQCEVLKPRGTVRVEGLGKLSRLEPSRERVFNNVPGFAAIPFAVEGQGNTPVTLTLLAEAKASSR